ASGSLSIWYSSCGPVITPGCKSVPQLGFRSCSRSKRAQLKVRTQTHFGSSPYMHSRSVISARVLIAVAALFVPLSVFGQTLVVNPTSLNVSAAAGSSVPSQNVTISRSGGGALRWSINSLVNWVQVSPVKGTDSGAVTVNFGTNRPTSSGTYPI